MLLVLVASTHGAAGAPTQVPLKSLNLSIDAVSPFTSISQAAPTALDVPRDVTIRFGAMTPAYPSAFVWTGAAASSSDALSSTASQQFKRSGDYVVTVTSIPTDPLSQGAPETQSITIHVGLTRASEVTITMIDPVPGAVEIGSVKRVWPCAAAISHPRYAHLVQWNASDVAPRSGFGLAFAPTFLAPGRHELRVGPNRRQAATFDIYAVSSVLVHSALGDAVDYGTPVTFTAITNPPGYAKYVGWRIDTAQDMHSHAEPVVGSGETFSATFTPSGGAALFWAQVYADFTAAFANPDLPNAGTVFDPFTKVTCAPTTTQLPLRVEQDGLKSESDACGPSCALGAVQLSNGQLILESSDLRIPGRGPAFEFHRAYRSQYACNGPLGNNWDFVYNMRLMAELDGGGAPTGNLILLDGLGRRDRFDLQGNGTYTSPPGHYRRLTRNADMTYTLLESNGTRELFSVLFPLANYRAFLGAIVDRNGNAVTLSYDPVNGRLNAVIDTLGRRILFVYNALGRLDHVTDFSGRSVAFLYDANGDLIAVTSPAVPAGSTPTGNDFPLGKTTRYAYSAGLASAAANHNMISVTRPNEAALVPQGPPALVNVYGTDPNVALEFDRVLRQSPGGTNAAAAARGLLPAGGNITYFYETLNPGADPNNLTVPRSRATVVNRDGDVSTFEQNVLGGNVAVRAYTGRVDAALPRSALQSLIPSTNPGFPPISRLRPSDPAFFLTSLAYNRDGEITLATRPEGNTKLSVFDAVNTDRLQQGNVLQVVKSPDAGRGGDQSMLVTAFSYEPIYNQLRTMCDARGTDPGFTPPVDPGVTGCARYTTRQTFDYEEGCDAAAVGARVGRSAAEVLTLWSAAGICATPAGDRNGDGLTNQTAGNVVRRDFPTVDLVAGSSEAIAEGDPMQEIVETLAYNGFGQPVRRVDPESNVTEYFYFPENDPDGDGANLTPGADPVTGGYLRQITRDTTSAPARETGTNPPPANIPRLRFYDRVGNVVREIDGRGIETRYSVNALNQVVQVTRAAAQALFTPDPPEPMPLAEFGYREQTLFDANDDVVGTRREDRGNTSDTGGFADIVNAYDILDRRIEESREASSAVSLVTGYRYDPDENQAIVIAPEGNYDTTTFDERDLVFQTTRGAGGPAGGAPATTTTHYDRNGNVVERVDAADTDGSAANNSSLGGPGDRTRTIYDGFDRPTSVVDSVGSQTVTQYDPAGNAIRVSRFGPVGGPSPTSDGPSPLGRPVSSLGVLQPGQLVNPNLLASTQTLFDESNRAFQTDQALFVNTIPTVRSPDLHDGAVDIGKGSLTPGDTCAVPGLAAPPSGWLGCVSTRTEFDRSSRVTFTVQDDLDTARNFHDGAGRVIRRVDPEGNAVDLAYDDDDNLIETRETDVSQVAGLPSETFLTTQFFDSLNRLEEQVDNLGQTTYRRYDSRGNVVAIADALGPPGPSISRRAFAPGVATVNATNLFGNVTTMAYDGTSRMIGSTRILTASGQGDGVHIGATIEGIPSATPSPDPSQSGDGLIAVLHGWDSNSRQSSGTDDNGNRTEWTYDNLDRTITETKGICSPPFLADRCDAPTATHFEYDPDGNLTRITDESGSVIDCDFDAINRRIVCGVTRAGGVVGTTAQSFEFDGLSNGTRGTDDNEPSDPNDDSVITMAHDSLGRLIEEVEQFGAQPARAISSAWRAENLRVGLTYPNGRRIDSTFDLLDRLNTTGDSGAPQPISDYDYIGPARVARRLFPQNGTRLTYLDDASTVDAGYDGLRRPVQLRHLRSNNSLIAGFGNGYDRANDRTLEEKLHATTDSELYSLDSQHRLRAFQRGTLNAGKSAIATPSPRIPTQGSWSLDGAGNWRQVDAETRQHTSFNEIAQRATPAVIPLLFDDDGNETDSGALLYQWDAFNRLRSVVRKSDLATIATYAYDASFRRIRKTVTNSGVLNGTTDFLLDGAREIEERTATGTLTQQCVFGAYVDEPLVLDRNLNGDGTATGAGDQRLFFHQNPLFSTLALTDSGGIVREGYQYDAYAFPTVYSPGANGVVDFGGDDVVTLGGSSAVANPYLFSGRRLDPETGEYQYRSRYLDPRLGRFLGRDAIGAWGDPTNFGNAYAYVGNSPTGRLDPFGFEVHACGDMFMTVTTVSRCVRSCEEAQLDPLLRIALFGQVLAQASRDAMGMCPINCPAERVGKLRVDEGCVPCACGASFELGDPGEGGVRLWVRRIHGREFRRSPQMWWCEKMGWDPPKWPPFLIYPLYEMMSRWNELARARRIAERNSPGSKMSGKEIGTMLLGGLGIIVVGGGVVVIVGGVVVVAGPEILAGGAALGEVLWPKLPDLAPATH